MTEQSLYNPTTSPFKTGIAGHCPQCQRGSIFKGYLQIAPACEVCGLDFGFADTADGPAFFAMSIVAPFSVALALWLAFAFDAPTWVHLVTTLPFTVISCMAVLRPLKGWMVCSKYFYAIRRRTKG